MPATEQSDPTLQLATAPIPKIGHYEPAVHEVHALAAIPVPAAKDPGSHFIYAEKPASVK